MANLLARIKIFPQDVNIDLQDVLNSINQNLSENMAIEKWRKEPIAYGLIALILDIRIADREGEISKLEETLKSSKYVGEIEVLGVSKLSTRIK